MRAPVAIKVRFGMQNRFRNSLGLVVGVFALVVVVFAASVASADEIVYSCESDLCIVNPDNLSEHRFLTETMTRRGVSARLLGLPTAA
jgi:hypothetical protein